MDTTQAQEWKPTIEEAGSALQDFGEVLSDLGIEYFLDGGTLLGFYRDGTFCEDDFDDIDLTTLASPAVMLDVIEKAAEKGFQLYKSWVGGEKTTSQVSLKRRGIKIDLMFKRFKENKIWWTVYRKGQIVYKSVLNGPIDWINPATGQTNTYVINTPYGPYWAPGKDKENVEAYFEQRYGDWTKKVHRKDYSCYSSDLAIKPSYEEI